MNKLLKIAHVLIVCLTISPSASFAGELPKALGITFGAPYEDVYNAYLKAGYFTSNNSIEKSMLMPSASIPERHVKYKVPLVDLKDATETKYYIFDGNVYMGSINFRTNSNRSTILRFNEIKEMISAKYGKPYVPEIKINEEEFEWMTNELRISISRREAAVFEEIHIKSGLYLYYVYLPLEEELMKSIKDKKAKEAAREAEVF